MQIYISRDGETKGPYSIEDVNAYLKDGTLLPSDLACQEGMDEWMPLNEIPSVIVTGDESTPTQNTESQIKPKGIKKKIFLSIGYSVLFAILTFWMSEATFRPPSTDREIDRDWSGWVKVISGESEGGYTNWRDDDVLFWGTGPVYAFVRIFYDKLGLHTYAPDRKKGPQTFPPDRHHPTDILGLLMWIFICSIVGSIIGFVWR